MTIIDGEQQTDLTRRGPDDGPDAAYALGGRVMAAAGDLSRQEAVFLELVGLFDASDGYRYWDGVRSTAHWLSWACSIAPGTAREHVRVARALRRMPRTHASFLAGELTYSKVRELTRLVDHFTTAVEAADPTASGEADAEANMGSRGDAVIEAGSAGEAAAVSEPCDDASDGSASVEIALTDRRPVHSETFALPTQTDLPSPTDRADDMSRPGQPSRADDPAIPPAPDRPDEVGLIRFAQFCTAQQLARTVSGYRAVEGTSRRRRERQRVSWVTRHDGNVHITMVLPPEEGAAMIAAIQTGADAARDAEARPGDVLPDDCHPGQSTDDAKAEAAERTRVEAVGDIANHFLASQPEDRSGEDRTLVVLEVSAAAVTDAAAVRASTKPSEDVPAGTPPPPVDPAVDTSRHTDTAAAGSEQSSGSDQRRDSEQATTDPRRANNVPAGTAQPTTPPPNDVPAGTAQPTTPLPNAAPAATFPPDNVPAGTLVRRDPATDPAGDAAPLVPDPHAQTCRVRGGAAIDVSAARRALCDSRIFAIITNQYGEPLAVGREQRLATRAQRRALMIRDGCCQYPGCGQTRRLKAHHRISWLDGGATDLDNLVLLCQWHHTRVHEDGIAITRCDRPGCPIRWQFTRPDRSVIVPIVAGRDEPSPWQPLTDFQGGPLPEGARDAARIRNDHRVAVFTSRQSTLTEQAAALENRYRHVDCPEHPEAGRVFPIGGGAGFDLAACVDALFGFVPPADRQAA